MSKRLLVLLLQVPVVIVAARFVQVTNYERATLAGQLLDVAMLLAAIVHVLLFSYCVLRSSNAKPLARQLWVLVALGAALSGVLLFAVLTAPREVADRRVLIQAAACGSLLAALLLAMVWPSRIPSPVSNVKRLGVTTLAGVVSIAGIQAWNSLEFTPSRQEPSLTTSTDLAAVTAPGVATRVEGTITVKNSGDVPALLIASEYTVWAVDVIEGGFAPDAIDKSDPMKPRRLTANGAVGSDVIGVGMPFLPYQRVAAKAEAQFRFSVLTNSRRPAVRVSIELFTARADRLFLAKPYELEPPGAIDTYPNTPGSQVSTTMMEGSRLRAFTRKPVLAVASWWHSVADGVVGAPRVGVIFYASGPHPEKFVPGELNNRALREYAVARQVYELTVPAKPEKTPDTPKASAG